MGNCLRPHCRSSKKCADGDDWDSSPESKRPFREEYAEKEVEEEVLLGEKKVAPSTELKIKITKKQLEELLGTVDIQGISVEQLLSQLMNASSDYQLRHQPWKPALQSIPEVN